MLRRVVVLLVAGLLLVGCVRSKPPQPTATVEVVPAVLVVEPTLAPTATEILPTPTATLTPIGSGLGAPTAPPTPTPTVEVRVVTVKETVLVPVTITPTPVPMVTVVVTKVVTESVLVTVAPVPVGTPTVPAVWLSTPEGTPLPEAFLPGGGWDSATLERWAKANLKQLRQTLTLVGISVPTTETLEFSRVYTGTLASDMKMLAIKPGGLVAQGRTILKAGTEVWLLVLRRGSGGEIRFPLYPKCLNLIAVLRTPGAMVNFTPVRTSTPPGPTATPHEEEKTSTPTPRKDVTSTSTPKKEEKTATPVPPTATPKKEKTSTSVPPTKTPVPPTRASTATPYKPEPTVQPSSSVPTATAQPVEPPPTRKPDEPKTPTPVRNTSTPVPPVVDTPQPNPTATAPS